MATLSCHEVGPLIELHAAGEGDPAVRAALERHAAGCPDCAAALEEARAVVALLDIRFGEPEALGRLHDRIEAEAAPRRARTLPFVRRALAVAAMLLIAVGLLPRLGTRDVPLADAVASVRWASPGARWAARSGGIEVSAGEVWLRNESRGSLKVTTPAGQATVEASDCFVKAGPGVVELSVRDGRATLSNERGSLTAHRGEALRATADSAPRWQVEALALRFGVRYRPVAVKAVPAVAGEPLDPALAVNYEEAAARFPLVALRDRLKAEGFVAIPGAGTDVVRLYRGLRDDGIPTVVTADAVLHLTRTFFQETLRDVEERVLAPELTSLLKALLKEVEAAPPSAARTEALTYLAVPLQMLDAKAAIPAEAEKVAAALLAGKPARALGRDLDPADYRPQGHYARSESLKRYYAAMTWLGGVPLRLDDTAEGRRETEAALLVTRALDGAKAGWEKIDAITSFFAGLSDGLGPQQYRAASSPEGDLDTLRKGLVRFRAAAVPGDPTLVAASPGRPPTLRPGAGFRLFGRRFVPDADVLARLTYPNVGPGTRPEVFTAGHGPDGETVRALPRGLDLMALLGSGRGRGILRETGDDAYRAGGGRAGYSAALDALRREYATLDVLDWNRNLYWSWLHALKPLLADGGGGQPFQAGRAYRTRLVNTALASWAQRRQDVALYAARDVFAEMKLAKGQPPEPRSRNAPPAFVEPLPELYGRLLALARMAGAGLTDLKALDGAGRKRFAEFERLLERLLSLAEKEAAGQGLSAAERQFLGGAAEELERAALGRDDCQVLDLGMRLREAAAAKDEKGVAALEKLLSGAAVASARSPALATVSRDRLADQVLQAGTGRFDVGVFVWRTADGPVLAAGPVFSYYEFKRPSGEALTDADWERAVSAGQAPPRPPWAAEYLAR